MIVAATLFGVELADVAPRDVSSLESAIMTAIWGPSRPCRAKEVVFALLLPGHRVAPSMVVPYKRMCWLAHIARVPGTAQTVTQVTVTEHLAAASSSYRTWTLVPSIPDQKQFSLLAALAHRLERHVPHPVRRQLESKRHAGVHSMERTVVITDVDTNRSLKTGITTQRISGVPKGTMRLWCMGLPRLVSAYQHVVQAFVDEDLNT